MSHPTLLAQIMAKRHWSSEDGTRAFLATAREMGEDIAVTERTWNRWCRGTLRQLPRMAACRVLERMFGFPVDVLLGPVERDRLAPAAAPEDSAPDMLRLAVEESTAHLAQVEGLALGPVTLEQAGDDVVRLARDYTTQAPAQALRQATRLRRRIAELLQQTTRPSQHNDLYLMIGQVCGLLSIASFDLGDIAAATAHARAAWGYGELIEDDPLRAWARGTQALLAYWEGRPNAAVHLARSGRGYVRAGTGLVRLHHIEARARSHQDDQMGALDALAAARQAAESSVHDPLHDGIGGALGFCQARRARCESSVHIRLRNGKAAAEAARRAMDAHADRGRPESHLLREARVELAGGLLLQGEPDGAAHELEDVLTVPIQHRITGLTERLRGTLRMLEASGTAPALAERVRDFVQVPAGRPLRV